MNKGRSDDGLSVSQRRERDAAALRAKQEVRHPTHTGQSCEEERAKFLVTALCAPGAHGSYAPRRWHARETAGMKECRSMWSRSGAASHAQGL